jgi:general secretion pathway protein J
MCHPRTNNGFTERAGFTLLEILIALFIFSLIVSVVFVSFREIAYSAGIVNKSNDDYEMAYGCFDLIRRDMASIYITQKPFYVSPSNTSEKDPFRVEGKTEIAGGASMPVIRFTTRCHLPVNRDNRKGIAEVVYYTDESQEYGTILRRSDRVMFEEEFKRKKTHPVILRKIKSLTVTYYDEDGKDYDEWDSETNDTGYATPSSIRIRVEIADEDRVLPFETRIVLRTFREKTKA